MKQAVWKKPFCLRRHLFGNTPWRHRRRPDPFQRVTAAASTESGNTKLVDSAASRSTNVRMYNSRAPDQRFFAFYLPSFARTAISVSAHSTWPGFVLPYGQQLSCQLRASSAVCTRQKTTTDYFILIIICIQISVNYCQMITNKTQILYVRCT